MKEHRRCITFAYDDKKKFYLKIRFYQEEKLVYEIPVVEVLAKKEQLYVVNISILDELREYLKLGFNFVHNLDSDKVVDYSGYNRNNGIKKSMVLITTKLSQHQVVLSIADTQCSIMNYEMSDKAYTINNKTYIDTNFILLIMQLAKEGYLLVMDKKLSACA